MHTVRFISAILAIVLSARAAIAFDSIKKANGVSVSGKILKIGWDKVEIEQGIGENKVFTEVPTKEIATIFFDAGSPPVKKALTKARNDTIDKKFAEVLKSLAKIDPADLEDEELKQDYDFYTALANAKLAFAGTGKIQDAGKAMLDFVKKNPNSYHFLEACEVLGDLLVAVRSYPAAEEYYGKLTRAPWPDVKMKAGVLIGRVQLAQNKLNEAEKTFQAVLDAESDGPQADSQRLSAKLGKASVLVARKQGSEAVEMLKKIIDKGDSEDAELMSRAYNALGTAYRQMGDPNEAKFAFLHTDQLYSSVPEAHAEALANLAEIWEQLHRTDRAVEARKTLDKLYKNSVWAKKEE